jgi:hypothetical protein
MKHVLTCPQKPTNPSIRMSSRKDIVASCSVGDSAGAGAALGSTSGQADGALLANASNDGAATSSSNGVANDLPSGSTGAGAVAAPTNPTAAPNAGRRRWQSLMNLMTPQNMAFAAVVIAVLFLILSPRPANKKR